MQCVATYVLHNVKHKNLTPLSGGVPLAKRTVRDQIPSSILDTKSVPDVFVVSGRKQK